MRVIYQASDLFEDDPLLNADEAARYLGIGKSAFHKLKREGFFPVVKIIGDVRVRRSDLNKCNATHLVRHDRGGSE